MVVHPIPRLDDRLINRGSEMHPFRDDVQKGLLIIGDGRCAKSDSDATVAVQFGKRKHRFALTFHPRSSALFEPNSR